LDAIADILFEPVGCLAEFSAEPFELALRELFGSEAEADASGSQAYWRLLGMLDQAGSTLTAAKLARLQELELSAVEGADLYEDVVPALEKLGPMGVRAHLVSSLSRPAVARFIDRFSLAAQFASTVSRDEAQGVMAAPVRDAVARAGLQAAHVIYLVDTGAALDMAKATGVQPLLMINDYDEGRALAERRPAGGVVSLTELPGAVQLMQQRSGLRSTARMPGKPFELFEPG
jgi:beta-phosphoglucomutase-like phosphatase (HAD superfamily)